MGLGGRHWGRVLSGPEQALIGLLTIVLMVGMGTSLRLEDFRRALAQPRAVGLGLASQYGWVPWLGAVAGREFGLSPGHAGLSSSAVVRWQRALCASYFARADLALSLSMTA